MDISYIINELGEDRSQYAGAVAPPIMQTAMFSFDTVEKMRETLQQESEMPFYTRGHNPTTHILEQKMAALENAEDALVFASGSAAVAAAVIANVNQGDHVVCVQKPYSWTNKLLNSFLNRFGVTNTMVDGTDPQNFESAIQPNTRVLFLESPNSWTFEQQDLAAVAQIAKKHDIVTIIDNSYATPLFQKPIDYGIDIVVHSATKYISGHSDTVAGVLCASKAMTNKIFASEYMTLGGVVAPFNAWLLLRGLRTLPTRMDRVSATTAIVVNYLQEHSMVSKIYYPYLESDPQYTLAKKQMTKGAGQFTIELAIDDIALIEKFCNHLQRFLMACSWGGHESLIFPACVLHTSANYNRAVPPVNMIRFCIGLETPEALIADIEQAFGAIIPEIR
ncbi:aminotransferase class I/II-fold pyridoxal phosphate-dependent enzyme [Microscilla marina]|uniref:Cys/Met metabolism pyridoxal-phosphate-dependent enzymes n=1 Tax=Microscilla marina ATCC 23134 TaxID=313606 RepID=A1ZIW0_MICM2|nr:aminotransferase class I/II-fold pyridoxal phosphate-dependent enzyme [Microscilla marina]EAY29496.1 Cys/Met metabolism pyridoxal-phosphate-dependent enzymes [Microscilla marina ATCC 23134]